VWEILIFERIFVVGNSNRLPELGLIKKISWAIHVFTLPNLEIFSSKNVKNKFTLGPTAQATLVEVNQRLTGS
jgi:hypothetical protein